MRAARRSNQAHDGNVPASALPAERDARVLIDRGDEFKLIAVTARGKQGGLCVAASIEERIEPGSRGIKLGHPVATCMHRITFEQPFGAHITQSRDQKSWIVFGVVADDVQDITFTTNERTLTIATENRAYYWKGRPDEIIRTMSAIRPDGSEYQFEMPAGVYGSRNTGSHDG